VELPTYCPHRWLNLTVDESFSLCVGSSAMVSEGECKAWRALYDATGGRDWTKCAEYRNDPCGGCESNNIIVCDAHHRITEIHLDSRTSAKNVVGTLPEALGQLTALKLLLVVGNAGLTGPIPRSIGLLTALTQIDLHSNGLTGSIPGDALAQLPHLSRLYLNDNRFSGTCPEIMAGGRSIARCDMSSIPFQCPAGSMPGTKVCTWCTGHGVPPPLPTCSS
jgi:hypothetical protein